ncbi:LuxR family transcriptional regulator [Phytoactinopolyspora mesophila]|uniref:Helix-turn-helix transcriptional regulator n=1 Tax=Phytoactinopolyspora mesophila TaxID=2650750 RepID=A0A7K3M2Q7_9ACTN|nr:LuxR family transcriptional regulator [Phytoactinopolyspora mesophila]NDL57574.1 helix-turn-helix transcriptional regulator [Phytoactinopolyspora mesophila]
MGVVEELARSREAYERRDWAAAYGHLSEADADGPLPADALAMWATAAHLLGRTDDCLRALQRAFQQHLDDGDMERAIRCCFWLGMTHMLAGDTAVAGGWWSRGWRLVEELGTDTVERGYLLIPQGIQQIKSGHVAASVETGAEVERLGRRFADADLIAMGLHARGRALLYQDRVPEGVALMDEALVGVAAGEVSPVIAGTIYCSTIEACQEISDFDRARQWTKALTRWCDEQPDLVPYTGQCAVHRGQLMRLHGALQDAIEELRFACRRYADSGAIYASGLAVYELGEVYRMRGAYAAAEAAYQEASSLGCDPQPGLALLRLAQGRTDVAVAAVRRLLDEADDVVKRSGILAACTEILLADGDIDAARAVAHELTDIARRFGCTALLAQAAASRAVVALADGDASAALVGLREAWQHWYHLGARYEAARARLQLGRACLKAGDEDSARMEVSAAAVVLGELGAGPLLAEAQALLGRAPAPGGLTTREVEVLRLVAAGKSNAAIAGELFLSEKTVSRHLSNIFTKIDVNSRTAAAAYAYEHHLV